MLQNLWTEGVLAFNVNEAILGEETYAVTTAKNLAAVLRNTVQVEPVTEAQSGNVRYGDKVRFVTYVNNSKVLVNNNSVVLAKHRRVPNAQLKVQPSAISLNNNPTELQQHLDHRALQPQVPIRLSWRGRQSE